MAKEMQRLKSRLVKMFFEKMDTLKRIRDEDGKRLFKKNFGSFNAVVDAATDDFNCVHDLLERLQKSGDINPKESTLLRVFLYLLVVEAHICNHLNFITYLLVTTGHDLYTLTRRKYVKDDVDEIRKVEMSTKIQFLKHHGFSALTKEYDSTFRNDIAHHNYKVDEKGVMWIRGKAVDLESKYVTARRIIDFTFEFLKEIRDKLDDHAKKKEVTKTSRDS